MGTTDIERLHYYQLQYLGATDFDAEQNYHRDMLRRHNLGQHTWGIVTGLELVQTLNGGPNNAVDVYVNPGMAVDGFGREIFVLQPYQLDVSLFQDFGTAQVLDVWIQYEQQLVQPPAAGYQTCGSNGQFNRIQETFQIVAGPQVRIHDPVTVGGKTVTTPPPANPGDLTLPYDESAPYQEFPDDNTGPVWLVHLGQVKWDGASQFLQISNDQLLKNRSYVGNVSSTIYAPSTSLLIKSRPVQSPLTDPTNPGVAAEIEGSLQVDRKVTAKQDVEIDGGKLYFDDQSGQDDGIPLWLQRTVPSSGTGADLRIHIGDSADATHRLTVGPASGGTEQVVLAVKADNSVDISTGVLNFGEQTRQMINLYDQTYGVGVQDSTLYYRSDSDFCWFRGGTHNDNKNNPGGGSLQLRLDDQARLYFGAQTRQMLNLWKENYGVGVQGWTLYCRSDADFCWFRGGTHSDTRDDPGAGGTLAMKLDSSGQLTINGDVQTTGSLTVANNLKVNKIGGTTNILSTFTKTMAVVNAGQNTPATWSVTYAQPFIEVYTAYVVLQGFSIWNYSGNTNFTVNSTNHGADVNAIPQHVFVRLTSFDVNGASGQCYCS
ncbi:MAG TPA: hypothetical protein VJQ82_05815, partial [Terriglobales bacterium]|nr:hypothetical protein [Terriglobales bacterium]